MVDRGYNYLDGSIQSMAEFFETRIENLEIFDFKKDSNKVQKAKSNKKRKYSNQNVSEEKNCSGTEGGKKFCKCHSTCRHSTNECTLIRVLVQKEKFKKKKQIKERKYAKHEVNILVEKKMKKTLKKRKGSVQKNFALLKT